MDMKRWNRCLLALVALLLILAIIATANIIIKQYSTEKMEFGNWSDWVSSLSTFGTLLVAAMAYRKAPDWINQRKNDAGFDVAQNVMLDDITNLYKHLNDAALIIVDLEINFDLMSDNPQEFLTVDDCDKNLEVFKTARGLPSQIKQKLIRLSKLGWNLDNELGKELEKIFDLYQSFYSRYNRLWRQQKRFVLNESNETDKIHCEKSMKMITALKEITNKFNARYISFDLKHKNFTQYFHVK